MRMLLMATTALAVGFAVPALAAGGSYGQQQGYNQGQSYSAPGLQSQGDQGSTNRAMGNQGSRTEGQGFQGQTSQNQMQQRYPGGNSSSGWSNQPSSQTRGQNQGTNQQFNSGSWSSQAENREGMGHRADQLRQRIRDDLAQGGFTDIHVIPRSFVVIAKDPEGNQVQMMITPNSLAEMTQMPMSGRMARNGDHSQYQSGNSGWNNGMQSSDGSN